MISGIESGRCLAVTAEVRIAQVGRLSGPWHAALEWVSMLNESGPMVAAYR